MSFATILSRSQQGLEAALVRVEVHVGSGHITVNLAPADLPKEGGRFDLPIAIGILVASVQLPPGPFDGTELYGELSLGGELQSPDGDESLSEGVRHAISRAPEIPGWEFHAFRQPRDAPPVVDLDTPRGAVEIDANDAEYVLLRARDGTFDMVVALPAAKQLRSEEQCALAVLLLDGLIGEEARMSLIKNVEFVEACEPKYQGRTTKIKHLRGHLDQQMRRERGSRSTQ